MISYQIGMHAFCSKASPAYISGCKFRVVGLNSGFISGQIYAKYLSVPSIQTDHSISEFRFLGLFIFSALRGNRSSIPALVQGRRVQVFTHLANITLRLQQILNAKGERLYLANLIGFLLNLFLHFKLQKWNVSPS